MKLKFIATSALILFFCFTASAQSGKKSKLPVEPPVQSAEKPEEKKDEPRGDVTPLKITGKPAPDPKVAADCYRREGFTFMQTVLRVTFEASGVISDVEVKTASGCRDFDEESIDAARRIKFVPAQRDGQPINVVKIIIYRGGIR